MGGDRCGVGYFVERETEGLDQKLEQITSLNDESSRIVGSRLAPYPLLYSAGQVKVRSDITFNVRSVELLVCEAGPDLHLSRSQRVCRLGEKKPARPEYRGRGFHKFGRLVRPGICEGRIKSEQRQKQKKTTHRSLSTRLIFIGGFYEKSKSKGSGTVKEARPLPCRRGLEPSF